MSRILLVCNEPDVIEGLRFSLEMEGHHLLTALDGWEALELVTGKVPDILITDWNMPRSDGLRLCQLLRQKRRSLDLPIIVISGAPPPKGWRSSLYDAYLMKPVAVDKILTLVTDSPPKPQ